MSARTAYDRSATEVRRPPEGVDHEARELVRMATLAASSHNTQPWTFVVSPEAITIGADLDRRCPVVDPDDAHLFKSLGCAAENVVHAAAAQGREARPTFDAATRTVVVHLGERGGLAAPPDGAMARAIRTRQCTRGPYDGQPLARDELDLLAQAGEHDGVHCVVLTAPGDVQRVIELVVRGDRQQLSDAAFRDELLRWIRFNPRAALRSRDGLAGRATGQPPLPTLLGRALQRVLIDGERQAAQDRERLQSSAGVAAFVTIADDPAAWVAAGRGYQRFALRAEALDVRTAFVNQPVEVGELRPELEGWLAPSGGHVQLLVRFGRGPRLPYSLRRGLDEVITG
jgi:hypothetical protein